MAMALGVGLFVAHRKFGIAAIGLALLEGFCRIYMGVHYPTDVIGGFASVRPSRCSSPRWP